MPQQEILISVIIPAYNAEKYIGEAIASVRSQEVNDIEIIIINDGSIDDTEHIVEALAKDDHRIKLINKPNSGKPSIARNTGINSAQGTFIALLDADDIMLPGKLQAQLNIFKQFEKTALIFHDCQITSSNDEIICASRFKKLKFIENAKHCLQHVMDGIYITNKQFYNFLSLYQTGIQTSQIMLKKDILLLEAEWFPESMTIAEDIDLWLRIAMNHQCAIIDKVYSQYRSHEQSITTNAEQMISGLAMMKTRNLNRGESRLGKHDAAILKNQIADKYRTLAYKLYNKSKTKQARKYYLKSFKIRPDITNLLSIIKTCLPFTLHNKNKA